MNPRHQPHQSVLFVCVENQGRSQIAAVLSEDVVDCVPELLDRLRLPDLRIHPGGVEESG